MPSLGELQPLKSFPDNMVTGFSYQEKNIIPFTWEVNGFYDST